MRGNLRFRAGAWRLLVDAGPDPVTGRRRQIQRTVEAPDTRRGRQKAETELAKFVAEIEAGRAAPASGLTVAHVLGILMFLASAGLGSGTTFADALGTRHGLELVAAGVVAAALFAGLVPLVVEVVLRRDVIETAGMFAGIETQPAALAYASERSAGDQRVSSAYALVFPAAMIAKIITVQFLV